MDKLSVVINTLNEEKNLPRALESVKNLADEVVVVDMRSDDRTLEIATKFGAKVYGHERTGYVEPARNFAISKAQGSWIFVLDADEVVPQSLIKLIKKQIKAPQADYFRIARKNIIFGKWIKHSRWWPDYNIRFFKKGSVSWSEIIHSVPTTKGSGLDFPAKEENAIVHYHYETVEQYIARLNKYTSQYAKDISSRGYKFNWIDLIRKPANEFLSRYFFGEGYKDGLHGLSLAVLQSFSEFVVYLKVWQTEKFEAKEVSLGKMVKEMKEIEKDVHYWQADTLLKEIGGIKYRFMRKLKI